MCDPTMYDHCACAEEMAQEAEAARRNPPDWAAIAPGINWTLFDNAIEYAIIYPEKFNMSTWGRVQKRSEWLTEHEVNGRTGDDEYNIVKTACGTVACYAGNVLLLSGYSLVAERVDNGFYLDIGQMATPDGQTTEYVPEAAMRLLGLSQEVFTFIETVTYDPHWQRGLTLFYGTCISDVITFRNTLVRELVNATDVAVDVVERDFAEVFAAAPVLSRVNAAWSTGLDLHLAAISRRTGTDTTTEESTDTEEETDNAA